MHDMSTDLYKEPDNSQAMGRVGSVKGAAKAKGGYIKAKSEQLSKRQLGGLENGPHGVGHPPELGRRAQDQAAACGPGGFRFGGRH